MQDPMMVHKLQQLKTALEQDSDIKLAILFGSCVNGNQNFASDIDIAMKLDQSLSGEEKIKFIHVIADIMGRAVDLVDLHKVGEPLLSQIIKNGVVLKGSQQMFIDLAIQNVYANADFLPYIKRSLQARREKWIK